MRAGSTGELAGGDSSGWEGRLPCGMCPYVLGTEGPCLEILIIHFLNSLPHHKFKEKPVSPGPNQAWHLGEA